MDLPDKDDVALRWARSRVPSALKMFVRRSLDVSGTAFWLNWEEIMYVVSFSIRPTDAPRPHRRETMYREFSALRDAGIQSPMSYPYFFVKSDQDLMLAQMYIDDMRAWDFRTGKQVVKR